MEEIDNPPIVWNFTNELGGHDILREISAEQRAQGKWYVKCKPIVKSEGFSFWRSLFRLKPEGAEIEANKEYTLLLEKGCRIPSPTGRGKHQRDVIIYQPVDPTKMKDWMLDSDYGMIREMVQEINIEGQRVKAIMKERQVTADQLNRMIASGGADEYIAKRFTESYKRIMEMVAMGKNIDEDSTMKKSDKK